LLVYQRWVNLVSRDASAIQGEDVKIHGLPGQSRLQAF
jgi:hypothetical protein